MKRLFALTLTVLLMACMLCACGGGTEAMYDNGMAMDMDAEMKEELAAPGEAIYGSTSDSVTGSTGSGSADAAMNSQKLIKTVTIQAETEDLDAMLIQLTEQIADLGGYIEFQNVYNGSAYAHYRSRNAELTIRIPAQRLDGFLNHVEGSSNVISKTESVDDVTLQYVDTQSRMEALQTEHDRLVELMEQAENLSDLLTIEERLTQVRYELESVASRLRVLDNQVDYATVELNIDEVEVYTEVEEPGVWQRVSTGFTDNLKDLGDSLVDLFVWVVTYSPQLLIFAGVVTLIVWLCRRSFRPRAKKNTPPPASEA